MHALGRALSLRQVAQIDGRFGGNSGGQLSGHFRGDEKCRLRRNFASGDTEPLAARWAQSKRSRRFRNSLRARPHATRVAGLVPSGFDSHGAAAEVAATDELVASQLKPDAAPVSSVTVIADGTTAFAAGFGKRIEARPPTVVTLARTCDTQLEPPLPLLSSPDAWL